MSGTSLPWFVIAVCYATGVLLVMLGIPLVRRRVAPNWTYGFRIPSTLANETVWYEMNARSGRHLIALAVLYMVLLTVSLRIGDSWPMEGRVLLPVSFLVVALIVDSIILSIAAGRMLRRPQGAIPRSDDGIAR